MALKTLLISVVSFALGVALVGFATPVSSSITNDSRAADAAAIRAHIESIFQAFIDGDIEKIRNTHSDDWRGILEGSNAPIKGIDEYMRANGIEWPRPANAPKLTPYYPPGTTYKISDFDVHFYGPELAVASFFGGFEGKTGNTTTTLRRFRIMDVYAKRKGNWIQVASHTVVDPDWRAEQMSQPRTITPEIRAQILAKRDAVWKAWFANDRALLDKLIPEEAIAINDGEEGWSDRAAIFEGSKRFAESGAKLVRLEFPKTEIQAYGNTVIIYTTYLYETESNGKRSTSSGRGTEMFVRRGDELVNVGWHLDSQK
jgi:hypothetical protein